jgi:hypothetical protein
MRLSSRLARLETEATRREADRFCREATDVELRDMLLGLAWDLRDGEPADLLRQTREALGAPDLAMEEAAAAAVQRADAAGRAVWRCAPTRASGVRGSPGAYAGLLAPSVANT